MTKLPSISGRQCIKALEKVGFYFTSDRKEATSSYVEIILSPKLWSLITNNWIGALSAP